MLDKPEVVAEAAELERDTGNWMEPYLELYCWSEARSEFNCVGADVAGVAAGVGWFVGSAGAGCRVRRETSGEADDELEL